MVSREPKKRESETYMDSEYCMLPMLSMLMTLSIQCRRLETISPLFLAENEIAILTLAPERLLGIGNITQEENRQT